jgi:hypothetical protein
MRGNEQGFKSDVQAAPLAWMGNKVNITTAYIAAELQGPSLIPKLTIGDGQYYNGYLNKPLKPGRNYRIYVRVVTKTISGVRSYTIMQRETLKLTSSVP